MIKEDSESIDMDFADKIGQINKGYELDILRCKIIQSLKDVKMYIARAIKLCELAEANLGRLQRIRATENSYKVE